MPSGCRFCFVQSTFSRPAGRLRAWPKTQADSGPAALSKRPWEFGPFFQGGTAGNRSDFRSPAPASAWQGAYDQHLGSILRGQFEYAGEIMPYWQAYTPRRSARNVYYPARTQIYLYALTAAAHLPASALRQSFCAGTSCPGRFALVSGCRRPHLHHPQISARLMVPHGEPGGTSVFNFTPQGGAGVHYFVNPSVNHFGKRCISPAHPWATTTRASTPASVPDRLYVVGEKVKDIEKTHPARSAQQVNRPESLIECVPNFSEGPTKRRSPRSSPP